MSDATINTEMVTQLRAPDEAATDRGDGVRGRLTDGLERERGRAKGEGGRRGGKETNLAIFLFCGTDMLTGKQKEDRREEAQVSLPSVSVRASWQGKRMGKGEVGYVRQSIRTLPVSNL